MLVFHHAKIFNDNAKLRDPEVRIPYSHFAVIINDHEGVFIMVFESGVFQELRNKVFSSGFVAGFFGCHGDLVRLRYDFTSAMRSFSVISRAFWCAAFLLPMMNLS